MSGFEIRISSADCARVAAMLNAVAERIEDTRPLLTQIRDYGVRAHQQRFDMGVGPDGKAWAPNTDTTMELKGGGSPLVDTGELRDSIRGYIRAPRTVVIGTSDFRGPLHQSGYIVAPGSRFAGSRVPARPFMGWSKVDRSTIEMMCKAFIQSRLP
jgi:phage gpG-like protein